MKTINLFTILLAVLLCLAPAATATTWGGQNDTTSTTLAAGVTSTSANTVQLASGTGVAAGAYLFVDREIMSVIGPAVTGSTTLWRVARNGFGSAHASGATVWVAAAGTAARAAFRTYDPSGSCTATNEYTLPIFNTTNGKSWTCNNSLWTRVSGGDPVLAWCGATSGATANCANTSTPLLRVIGGKATLASNAQVVTFAPGFSATTTYTCVANDITTRANPVQAVPTSATTMTITNTTGATDVVNWICLGY